MFQKIISITILLVLSFNTSFAQQIESVILKAGESTTAHVAHPTGFRQYAEVKYQIHCVSDLNIAGEVVSKKGGIALTSNGSIIVENKNLTKRNHHASIREIYCDPQMKGSSNTGLISANTPRLSGKRPSAPELENTPAIVESGRHLVPEFEYKIDNEVQKVAFALHCTKTEMEGSNAVLYNGGISIGENSMVVIEDKFEKQKGSLNQVALVKCQKRTDTSDVIRVDADAVE